MSKTTETTSPAASAIANWWADHVFGGTIGRIDHPSHPEPNGGITMALAVAAGRQGVPAESSKRDVFVNALARRIAADLERYDDVTLGVDYGTDPMLADAAKEAGVSTGSFP
ncbi:MAG: hypothetical protein JWR90_466, partial [Marmoricola sp.]|nr:hypothetical protein [Marmoricola sp.]